MNWHDNTQAQRRAMALELFIRTYGVPVEIQAASGDWILYWGIQHQPKRWLIIEDKERTYVSPDGYVSHFKSYVLEVNDQCLRQRSNEETLS